MVCIHCLCKPPRAAACDDQPLQAGKQVIYNGTESNASGDSGMAALFRVSAACSYTSPWRAKRFRRRSPPVR